MGERVEYMLREGLEKLEELWASTGITNAKLKDLLYHNILKVHIGNLPSRASDGRHLI